MPLAFVSGGVRNACRAPRSRRWPTGDVDAGNGTSDGRDGREGR